MIVGIQKQAQHRLRSDSEKAYILLSGEHALLALCNAHYSVSESKGWDVNVDQVLDQFGKRINELPPVPT